MKSHESEYICPSNASASRLFPDLEPDEVLAPLLLEHAQRGLIKYEAQPHIFQAKYGKDFTTFRQEILATNQLDGRESDYFDWELAVTGNEDMTFEIQQIQRLAHTRST